MTGLPLPATRRRRSLAAPLGLCAALAGAAALLLPDAGSAPPEIPPLVTNPTLAVEDTFNMPTTTLPEYLVEAPRVTLEEILRRVAAGEARRDSLMQDQAYTVFFKVIYANGDGEAKVARDVVSRIYKRKPDQVREVRLREEGDDMYEFRVEASMGEQYVSFAFRPDSRSKYNFTILERIWAGGHVVYRIAFEPKSKVDPLPTGTVWIDTNEFVIVRQEFGYADGSPLPLFLKSFEDCVVERTRVDGDWWVWTRFFVRVETTSALRWGAKLGGHSVGERIDLYFARTNWEVNRGLPDSLFAAAAR